MAEDGWQANIQIQEGDILMDGYDAMPAVWQELVSAEDQSRNFVLQTEDGGAIECRFVRREARYFIVYLSSHTGCRQACRFCHLTQTGQTMMSPVGLEGFIAQAKRVLAHYDALVDEGGEEAEIVNFNFMARGEALSNPTVTGDWPALMDGLRAEAYRRGLRPQFNVSTILPQDAAGLDLTKISGEGVSLYYSLYALDPEFRKRWLPRAEDPAQGLERLAEWQAKTGGEVVLHWALIAGENDRPEQGLAIAAAAADVGLKARFNLVRYNPFSENQGRESGRVEEYFAAISEALGHPCSRIVPRVGFDVKASCGMFVS